MNAGPHISCLIQFTAPGSKTSTAGLGAKKHDCRVVLSPFSTNAPKIWVRNIRRLASWVSRLHVCGDEKPPDLMASKAKKCQDTPAAIRGWRVKRRAERGRSGKPKSCPRQSLAIFRLSRKPLPMCCSLLQIDTTSSQVVSTVCEAEHHTRMAQSIAIGIWIQPAGREVFQGCEIHPSPAVSMYHQAPSMSGTGCEAEDWPHTKDYCYHNARNKPLATRRIC
jgi:hypothetical protein